MLRHSYAMRFNTVKDWKNEADIFLKKNKTKQEYLWETTILLIAVVIIIGNMRQWLDFANENFERISMIVIDLSMSVAGGKWTFSGLGEKF